MTGEDSVEPILLAIIKSVAQTTKKPLAKKRNDALFDIWSIIHFVTSAALAIIIDPFLALAIVVVWEPLEVFIISPLLAKIGVTFGHETLRNVMSDLIFDLAGVLFAVYAIKPFI